MSRGAAMPVETLGEAWNFSWRLHMRCLDDGREGLKHERECGYRTELDMQTLVCTRGRDFPLSSDRRSPSLSPMWLPPSGSDVRPSHELRGQYLHRPIVQLEKR